MKKRIMLMIVMGLSIAPAIFADSDHLGEEKLSQTGEGAAHCTGRSNEDKVYASEGQASPTFNSSHGSTSSSSAR